MGKFKGLLSNSQQTALRGDSQVVNEQETGEE